MFPELTVRELVGNALIHQDFFVSGVDPMAEIFDDRLEVTNPGEPLVDTRRFRVEKKQCGCVEVHVRSL